MHEQEVLRCASQKHPPSPSNRARPLQVICWVLGEYGRLASRCGVEGVMDRLAAIPETQTADDEVRRGRPWLGAALAAGEGGAAS